jgi:Ca2+-binding EF-hand superfamily protein
MYDIMAIFALFDKESKGYIDRLDIEWIQE